MERIFFQVDIAHWGWVIAFFLWFVGIAGMLSLAYPWVRRPFLPPVILVSLALGLAFVFSHLTRWWNVPKAFLLALFEGHLNWGSWMALGVFMLTFHFLLSLVLFLGQGPRFRLPWAERLAGAPGFVGLLAVSGVAITVYSGFLISQAAGIPLWNTPMLPLLWLVSGAVAAYAVLEIAHLLGLWEGFPRSGVWGLALDGLKALFVFAFLYVTLSVGTEGARVGAWEMLFGRYAGLTWLGVVGLGLALPLAVGLWSLKGHPSKPLTFLAALGSLLGGLFLRASILLAGAWEI